MKQIIEGMKLEHAQQIAESLKAELEPYCERIEIAGSIRRKKPEVKDIEFVCIPKFAEVGTGQTTLFGGEQTITENLLFGYLTSASKYSIEKIGDKYCQFNILEERIDDHRRYDKIQVDLFTATEQTWGYIFLIRTGPADFSKWVVTELKRRGFTPKGGAIYDEDMYETTPVYTPTEKNVFELLQIHYLEPEDRC